MTPSLCSPLRKGQTRRSVFRSQLGTQEDDFPDHDVKSHAIYPNQEFCTHSHLCISDGNKYTTTCHMQFSSRTFSFIRASLFPCSCRLTACPGTSGKAPNALLHVCLCKEGTEGTIPASSFTGTRTDKTADFLSQKVMLPKFPSWSLPTSKSTSDPCRNHLPLLQVTILQLAKHH